ncbi:MAG: Crp/Fnr family transcriptional regulator [Halarcobacter sp.]
MELNKIYLFEDLEEKEIKEIEKIASIKNFNKDNILFYEGDESKYLYILLEGEVKLYKVMSQDRELVLKHFYKNEFIAEVANFEGIDYPATAQAITDIKVLRIEFASFKEQVLNNPKLSFMIMKSLIKKIRNLENVVSTNLILDTKQRVANYIYKNSDDFFNTKNIKIAQVLNMTPETLSRVLRIFKDEGIINMKNKTINLELLKNYLT